jgi:hypothetical protein
VESIERLKKQLERLETKIKAAEQQLPAHSTKPPVMTTLLDLEDERDALLEKIKSLR